MWLPNLEQVLRLHGKLIERTGGSSGIRDLGLVESALMRANAAFGGHEPYITAEQKAAVICCGLIQNHGFVDGNKRIGIAVLLLILTQNDVSLQYSQEELVDLGLSIARGTSDVEYTLQWILKHKHKG